MRVPCHGACLDDTEDARLMGVVKRRWYTAGPECHELERRLREYTGKREVILCNSGSSANLLAVTALTSTLERNLRPGDEVITTALAFPTTINPILQNGCVPVVVDVNLPGMEPNMAQLHGAMSDKTRAVILAHTMGYPFNAYAVRQFCAYNHLWLIEDCCDALGSPGIMQGDMSTLSFYPAHQMTTGEGGAVLTDSPKLAHILRSFRDWGKDCWCSPGVDNTCGRRFDGELDHKYSFSRLGYNLKLSDLHASIGVAQMDKLPGFVHARMDNHHYLYAAFKRAGMDEYFILPPDKDASWFGFTLICRNTVKRNEITRWLEDRGIQTRIVFGGNILRHEAYKGANVRKAAALANTDIIHYNAFWVGCWPGLERAQLDYIVENVAEYCKIAEATNAD